MSIVWLWIEGWSGPAARGGVASWLNAALFGLALSAPTALVGCVVFLGRRERRHAAEALRRQAQRRHEWLELLNLIPIPLAIGSAQHDRVVLNRVMAHVLQFKPDDPTDCPLDWRQIVAPQDWSAWAKAIDLALQSGRPQWLRCTMRLADTSNEVLAQIAAIGSADGVALAFSVELPRGDGGLTQETILQLRELLGLAEAEKWHFGQAVHDELGQRLSGIAFFAKALQRNLQIAKRCEADDAAWLNGLANESMSVARDLARGLVPVGTNDPDALAATLADLCHRAGKAFHITCELKADPGFDPGGAAQANHLYHAIQEMITNAMKHGRARTVQVGLEVLADRQRVKVRNDGVGLGPAPTRRGMGLNGVRSRAAYLGGTFSLADEGQGGVLAAIDLPLPTGSIDSARAAGAVGSIVGGEAGST